MKQEPKQTSRPDHKGTHNPNARLTDKIVLAIAGEPRGWGKNRGIAQKYGVSYHTVVSIQHGRRWASVTGE